MTLRRKRMILMDGQWYGYLRTASGNPLTLQNAKRLRKLTIYGNAVQDGTPSPDAPVEVQLCGDRTGNLFDKDNASVQDNWVFTSQGDQGSYNIQNVSDGETITIAFQLKEFFTKGSINIRNASNSVKTSFSPTSSDLQVKTITYAEGDKFDIYAPYVNSIKNNYMQFVNADVRIYKGSYTADTLPAYEPYGYKVSGRAEGLNLLDYTKATDRSGNPLTIIDDGVIWDKMIDYYFYIPCDLKSGITVSFSCKSDYPENSDIINSFMVHYVDGSTEYQPIGFSLTLKNDVDRIQIRKRSASTVSETPIKVTDIMLVQGSYTAETMPPYEPYQPPQDFAVYLPEQIAKVGDVADEVVVDMESKTAELKKKYFRYDFTGDGNWDHEGILNRFKLNLGLSLQDKRYKTPSNRFETTNIAGNKDELIFAHANYIYVYHYDSTTKEEFNAFFTDNPTYAYIPYSAPVTTDITSLQQWDAMPQVSGTVTLTLSAEVEPSGAEAVYYSKERGE